MERELLDGLIRRANGSGNDSSDALRQLAAVGGDAIPAILDALRSDGRLTKPVVSLIGALAEPRHIPVFAEAIFEDNYHIQMAAVDALGGVGGNMVLEPLGRLLRDESFGMVVRSSAARALGRTGRAEAVPSLLEFGAVADDIEDDNIEYGGTREIAVTAVAVALARLGRHDFGPQVVGLLAHPFPPARALAARALHETVAPGMFAALRPLVRDKDSEARLNAILAIYLLGAKPCISALLPVLDMVGSEVRQTAAIRLLDLTNGEPDDNESADEFASWWSDEQTKAPDDTVLWKLEPRSVTHLVALLHDGTRREDAAWELDLVGSGIHRPGTDTDAGWNAEVGKAEKWLVQEGGRFKPGRLYKHGFEIDLAPLIAE